MSPFRLSLLLVLWPLAGAHAANDIDAAARCGLDPAMSRFETTHHRGGDVTVRVAVDADGRPLAALDAGALAAKIIASGPADRAPTSTPASATRTTVVCTSGVRSVATTVPLENAEPVVGLPPIDAMAAGCASYADWAQESMQSVALESATPDGRVRQRVTLRRVSPAARDPAAPVCAVSKVLVVCMDEARCSMR